MATIASRIKEGLALRGMTQAELVAKTQIGKSSISTYLSGAYEPKQRNIYKIAKALDVSETWLLGLDDCPQHAVVPAGFLPVAGTVKRPRLGVISCGEPLLCEENFDGYDEVPTNIPCDFTLKCSGDSMTGARIYDGDIVYIKQQPIVENGQIAAVLIDGEALLKRVYVHDDSMILQAENPQYPPRVYRKEEMNRIRILGRAVGFTGVL